MREILFKGFYTCENGTQIAVVNGKEYRGEWIEGDLLSKCSVSPKISIHGEYNRGLFVVDSYAVIPETVCEWTGLTDKDGKKIFEGDIVKARINTDYYICKFEDCKFSLEDCNGNVILLKQSVLDRFECEVIGTIFDKELKEILEV